MDWLDDVSTCSSCCIHCLAAHSRSHDRDLHLHDQNTPDPLYIFYIDFLISDLYSDIYKGDGIETSLMHDLPTSRTVTSPLQAHHSI